MKNKKLAVLFKSLTKEEVKDLKKYLKGTSYTSDSGLYKLFEYLQKHHPNFPDKKLEKTLVNKAVFGKSGDDFKLMHDISSKLYAVIENFLIQQKLEESYTDKSFLMLKILEERNLDKLFLQKAGALERYWEKKPQAGVEHLYHRFHLAAIKHAHPTHRPEEMLHLDLMEELDQYYFAHKLLLSLNFLNTNRTFTNENKDNKRPIFLLEEIVSCSSLVAFQKIPQIELFYLVYESLEKEVVNNAESIKMIFEKNIDIYDDIEQDDLYHLLLRMFYKNYLQGQKAGLEKLFDFIKFALEYHLVIADGVLDTSKFKNFLFIGFAAADLDWCEWFLKEYKSFLPIDERDNLFAFGEALLALNKEQYLEALEKLRTVEFKRISDKNHVRLVTLQCYFELDSYENVFLDYVKTFRQFVSNSKFMSNSSKENWKNLISYAKRIFVLKTGIGLEKIPSKHKVIGELKKIEKSILNDSKINSKAWLLKKVKDQILAKENQSIK